MRYRDNTSRIIDISITCMVLAVILSIVAFTCTTVVGPNERGVRITLGSASENAMGSGFKIKWPIISEIRKISVATQNSSANLDVFSKDLQSVEMNINVIYHYTPEKVVKIVTDFQEDPVETVLTPMVHEALKEICKDLNSEEIVQRRGTFQKIHSQEETGLPNVPAVCCWLIDSFDNPLSRIRHSN